MDRKRWEQLEDLLQRALDVEPDKRAAFLQSVADDSLRSEVEALLNKEADAGSFLESPAVVCVAEELRPAFALPARISHYRIEARIGEGGMGEVYRAHDETLRRVVALKVLPADFTFDPERVQRFEQEAFAASRLNHPNIITIFEIAEAEGAHFIVQELVEGETLRQLMAGSQSKRPRPLGIERALDIAIQIVAALKAAHTAWIIHRDIKPENIMVRRDGLVKVLDFGIAKLDEEPRATDSKQPASEGATVSESEIDPVSKGLTISGTIMGTASYMSPEQARGEQLDGRTDLFSVGLLLYEMVTGDRLFGGVTRAEALQAVQHLNEALPPNLSGNIPKELRRIIQKALRRDRDERYASAGDMLEDLKGFKRRLENRLARRVIGLSALIGVAAIALVVVAGFLSVSEVWEEKILRDGHTAAVRRAVFSPDGRLLVSGGEDHQVIVWDFSRRQRLKTLTDHTREVNAVAFSPNGKWFVTGSQDQTVIVWDASRLAKALVLQHNGPVHSVTFSPDGTLLASSSSGPNSVSTTLWETVGWKKLRELPDGIFLGDYHFLANNRWLLDATGRLWNLSTGLKVRDSHPDLKGNWASVSPDGKRWVSVDVNGQVKFVDLTNQKSLGVRRVHHDHGRAVAFSPDGRWLATAAERIVLWDVATLTKLLPLEYESIVWSVAFSPDGRWLVSTHGDGAILVWDVAERELAANLREHSGGVRAVTFSPDGKRVATASEDHSVIIWDADSGHKQSVLEGHRTRVMAVAFSSDGKWLASTDQDSNIIRWDVAKRSPQLTLKPMEWGASYCLAISPDGRTVATTNAVYNIESGHKLLPSVTDWAQVYSAAFTRDGQRLIGVTVHGAVLLGDTSDWQVKRHKLADSPLVSLSLSTDGHYLVTGEDGKAVRLWSLEPLRELGVIGWHEARIKSVAFSPDGTRVASAGDDRTIRLWDVRGRRLITTVGTHSSPIYSIAFSPDGQRLISGEHDRSVRLYTRHLKLWGYSLK